MLRLRSRVRARLPFTKELFQIIPMHMMSREIIPGRKKEVSIVSFIICDHCCQFLLTPWLAASRSLATPAWLKLKGMAGHWLVQHTAPVRAKPDSRLCLEGAHYKYPTNYSLSMYHFSTLGHCEVSALGSGVGWTPALNNEWTIHSGALLKLSHVWGISQLMVMLFQMHDAAWCISESNTDIYAFSIYCPMLS